MAKPTKRKPTKALVLQNIQLQPAQQKALAVATPPQFIKTRKGRGGKEIKYIEGGYVVAKLNEVIGAPNWDFEVLEQGTTERKNGNPERIEGEVWVRGKLTIIDHKNGYRVSKVQYGQHDIAKGVPLGDSFKSASTDCLKKCASLFGVALDVYWQQLDEDTPQIKQPNPDTGITKDQLFIKTVATLENVSDIQQLRAWRAKVATPAGAKLYGKHYEDIVKRVDEKIKKLT